MKKIIVITTILCFFSITIQDCKKNAAGPTDFADTTTSGPTNPGGYTKPDCLNSFATFSNCESTFPDIPGSYDNPKVTGSPGIVKVECKMTWLDLYCQIYFKKTDWKQSMNFTIKNDYASNLPDQYAYVVFIGGGGFPFTIKGTAGKIHVKYYPGSDSYEAVICNADFYHSIYGTTEKVSYKVDFNF